MHTVVFVVCDQKKNNRSSFFLVDPLYIIVEYLSRGNLKDLLKDSRSKGGRVYGNLHGISKSLTSGDLMKFAKDVADGMTFISSQQVKLALANISTSKVT